MTTTPDDSLPAGSNAARDGSTSDGSTGKPGAPDHEEPHPGSVSGRLNWLRAGVLGANDGIISTAGLVLGVAGATSDRHAILIAGLAGLVAGALSMAAGEYVSVSTQRDAEKALLDVERQELRDKPHAELAELTQIYVDKGLDHDLAARVAEQLTDHDALAAHAEAELHLDPEELTNPWSAAAASFVSFAVGALLPLLTIVLVPPPARVAATFVAVLIALVLTGSSSARMGQAPVRRALLRNVGGGFVAMAVTYAGGTFFATL